ncbi:hypothetical protein JW872_00960 [Candidatus Babeliales bacterium]|nr:hypothetical protein [Candidatus Babeliales bacterium]
MDRYRILTILLSVTCLSHMSLGSSKFQYQPHIKRVYSGSLRFPDSITPPPRLTAYYKGIRVDIQNGNFTVRDTEAAPGFYFLFTLSPVTPCTDAHDPNTIQFFQLDPESPYKCFRVLRTRGDRPWLIEETPLEQTRHAMLKIPESTIIIPLNPDYVEAVQTEADPSPLHSTSLPDIIFKKELSQNKINEMVIQSTFAALDLNPFHRKPTIVQSIDRNAPHIIMSMVTE